MYKIHCGGFISQHLFGDNLEELKKQVEEDYASCHFRDKLGQQYLATGRLYKNVLSIKTYWKQYKNKFRYYEETNYDVYELDDTKTNETFKWCIETITELKK